MEENQVDSAWNQGKVENELYFQAILVYCIVLWFWKCLSFVTLIVGVKEDVFNRSEF